VNPIAARLIVRLIAIQFVIGIAAELVVIAFAPRLLLLDSAIVVGTLPLTITGGIALLVVVAAASLYLVRPLRPMLRALASGSDAVEPESVLALHALPLRIVVADVGAVLLVTSLTVLPPFRPITNDFYTQAALVLLTMTIISAAALPLYVMMRARVASVLELVPAAVTREALAMMDLRHRRFAHVRQRFVVAVATPVAFVAVGAFLLVYAHSRAFDIVAREAEARAIVSAGMDLVDGDASGRAEGIVAAAAHGFRLGLDSAPSELGVARDDEGQTRMSVPLEAGHAIVDFETTRLSPVTWVYVLLAMVATGLAALLGSRLGQWFVRDVALATRAVRETGAADVVRGTRVRREARFSSIRALMDAIDELGGVFRGFASAQEHAIEARAATERMRALFLASMSHDLKGPLNAILGFAELVSRGRLTNEQRESIAIVAQRGRELLTLIQTILDSARAEAGELTIGLEWTMMGDVVMSAVLEARDLAVGSGVEVVGEIQPGVPRMYIDGTRMVQALSAVIVSAVRFTEKGVVHVRATAPAGGDRLRIDVESSGRTVPSSEFEKIFEAFKDSDRARRHGSLGLGLSLARSIVEIHAGGIGAAQTAGGGMAFHVWLPTSAERIAVKAAESSSKAADITTTMPASRGGWRLGSSPGTDG
jgi:signal transduction histidine kinase